MDNEEKNLKRKHNRKRIALYAAAGVVMAGLIGTTGYLMVQQRQKNLEAAEAAAQMSARLNSNDSTEEADNGEVVYQGESYEYNTDLKTVLFLGVDKQGDLVESEAYGTRGQSDCLILLVMNTKTKTTDLVEISRDTMTDVDVYSLDGKYMRTITAQIATQYAYGDGAKRSCQFTKSVVSNLMYGIPIQNYIALDISGIGSIVDGMGGVQITVPEDYTSIDAAFVKDSNITLNGTQAEKYVRYRDINVFGSNNQRMERQTQFIGALFSQWKGQDNYDAILDSADPYMVTDMDVDTLKSLSEYDMNEDIQKVTGEDKEGEEHDEYYVDEDALYELILDTFYVKK